MSRCIISSCYSCCMCFASSSTNKNAMLYFYIYINYWFLIDWFPPPPHTQFYLLTLNLFCTISHHTQKKKQFPSCQRSALNWNWDRNSDRRWQETSVWIGGVDRDVSISLLLYLPQGVFNRVWTALKTVRHTTYWMCNLEKQMTCFIFWCPERFYL